jgi:hypothetical protein
MFKFVLLENELLFSVATETYACNTYYGKTCRYRNQTSVYVYYPVWADVTLKGIGYAFYCAFDISFAKLM